MEPVGAPRVAQIALGLCNLIGVVGEEFYTKPMKIFLISN